MKLINDAGEVVADLPDNDVTVVLYGPEGFQIVAPHMEDEDELPDHVLRAASSATYGEEHAKEVVEWFVKRAQEHAGEQ